MKADSIRSLAVQNIRMTNNIRIFLWLGLALALFVNYTQWQQDYAAKPATVQTSTDAAGATKPVDIGDVVPQAVQSKPVPGAASDVPTSAAAMSTRAASAAAPAVLSHTSGLPALSRANQRRCEPGTRR